jgi:hypothetical protein
VLSDALNAVLAKERPVNPIFGEIPTIAYQMGFDR